MRYQFLLSLLVLGGSILRADQFSFSYSGEAVPLFGSQYAVNASGTLTASNLGSGLYEVTGIKGTRDGATISQSGNLGILSISNGLLGLSGVLVFNVNGVGTDTLAYTGGVYTETLVASNPLNSSFAQLNKFAVAVPEPSTVLIFLTLGAVVWVFRRKLPTRAFRKR